MSACHRQWAEEGRLKAQVGWGSGWVVGIGGGTGKAGMSSQV